MLKVYNLGCVVDPDENIIRFYITMHNVTLRVQKVESIGKLYEQIKQLA